MIVVILRVLVPPENRRELLQTIRSLHSQISSQSGCLASHYYLEVENEAAVCLIEEWESQIDLDNHMRSNVFAVLIGAISLLSSPAEMEFKVLSLQAGIESVQAARRKVECEMGESTDGLFIRIPQSAIH
ncbi:MAG: antibiotic biosynthesis monooxygenase [Acidobacteria bacterium]|nr:antibiotic biosynthesis monooxygenase [Acidobacteriota bacterium]